MKNINLDQLHKKYPLKRVAITGAGSGLGRELALILAKSGWTMFLNDNNSKLLNETLDMCSVHYPNSDRRYLFGYVFDVANFDKFSNATHDFINKENGVDLVFTCAGVGVGCDFLNTENDHIRKAFNTNVLGTMWAGKLFLPSMKNARQGHFVTIASAASFHGLPHLSVYAATKSAVVQFSETLRSEMKEYGVNVTVKMTTFYTSSVADFTLGPEQEREKARSLVELAPWHSRDVARSLLKHVQRRKFYMVAPSQAKFLWIFKRLLPELYLRLVPKVFPKLEAKLLSKYERRKSVSINHNS